MVIAIYNHVPGRENTDFCRQVVCLIKDPTNLVEDYCNRPDHTDFRDFINSASDLQRSKDTCNTTLKSINAERCRQIKASQYFWLERDEKSTVEETVRKVEQHFGW